MKSTSTMFTNKGLPMRRRTTLLHYLLLLCALFYAAPSWAAVGDPPVQQTVCNVTSSSTPTCTYGSAVTAGNTLVAQIAVRTAQTITSLAEGVNGAWTCPAGSDVSDGTSRFLICRFNNTGSGTPTLTLTMGGASVTYWNISEWSGVADASEEDALSEGSDGSSPFTAGAGLTSTTAGLIVCGFAANATISGATPATGFTAMTNNGVRDYFQYRVGAATTSDCSTSLTGPTTTSGAMMALKEAAAGGAAPRNLATMGAGQ
jgi:hypothetical protein